MHIAFDGGCFQQGILGGIYQVARGYLNAAKALHPNLEITLVCDPRQGTVKEEALAGLSWRPEVVYAPVAVSYDPPQQWPMERDANVRFYVDGRIVPAVISDNNARYVGPPPSAAFAIISRAAGVDKKFGIRIDNIEIRSDDRPVCIDGNDRRLATGFHFDDEGVRWTDGAGFIPLAFFAGNSDEITVDVAYTGQDGYRMPPGPGTELLRQIREDIAATKRDQELKALSDTLLARGCTVYFANHFTPINVPGLINVAWAYDLIPVLLPQYFHADARLNFDENLRIFAAADRVYAISECTRNDLVAHTPVKADQVITAGIASSGDFSPRVPSAISRVIGPLGLREKKYILVVGTVEPRKNHLRMLLAYLDLRRRMSNCPDLVIIGKLGWDFDQILRVRAESGLEHNVKILSDVSDEDLACFYSGAMFSAYLSVYEGFGLPIIESMAAGCPVLTSDRSSMAEVANNAAMLVNPYEIDEISAAMQRMATNKQLRVNLSQRGLARVRNYNWELSSDIIMRDLAALVDA